MLNKLRSINLEQKLKNTDQESYDTILSELNQSGVKFASTLKSLDTVFYEALDQLSECVDEINGDFVLFEGGIYKGSWIESTGTINSEILARFVPSIAKSTFELFVDYQREDGLMPFHLTLDGPAYRQIQIVTPLARSVWHHYLLNQDKDFLRKMYEGMKKYDEWLMKYRNTRETGCIEAFCTYDTGHDLSPRFWHVPDVPFLDEPDQYDLNSPILPFLAPDLTANVYCQRKYLDVIAEELNEDDHFWMDRAGDTLKQLMHYCYDAEDGMFYDVDKNDNFVRIQSDILLRVLACEVGDDLFFKQSLQRYLLNTRKFFARYPLTSIAMDDPRFDRFCSYNSWAGPTNFLTLIRSPHAFEYHHHFVELTWIMKPILSAMLNMTRFPQILDPWTGEAGFTEKYSPSILCLLDFVERLCGILPRPEGVLWFTGLLPHDSDHGLKAGTETAYSRSVDGNNYELINTLDQCYIYRNEELLYEFPMGIRVVTNKSGDLHSIIGMTVGTLEGVVRYRGEEYPFIIRGNETLLFDNGKFDSIHHSDVVMVSY